EAPVAIDRGDETVAAVLHALTAVRRVEACRLRVGEREADLQLSAGRRRLTDVLNDEARLLMVGGDRARHVRLLDERIGVAQAEILDVFPELPIQRTALALAEEVRLVEADEAADAISLSDRRAEVDVAGALFLDVEDDVDVALVVHLARVRRRHVLLEEAEVGDVAVAVDQALLVEYIARNDEQLPANA